MMGLNKDIKMNSFIYSFSFILLLFCQHLFFQIIFLSISNAEDVIEVRDIEYSSSLEKSQIIIHLSGRAKFTVGKLTSPDRLFFDIKTAKLKSSNMRRNLLDSSIKSIRASQFNTETVRIVFDMNIPDYEYKIIDNIGSNLIIEIYPNGLNEEQKNDFSINKFLKKIIVLDPGHGGHDPGAIGPRGLYEKHIVLDIAQKVKDIISKNYPNYEVIMTRNDDVFIPLSERTAIANRVNADLFVSIHTNSSPNNYARGIETYVLNWTDDEESMRVAARENAISLVQMKKALSDIGLILASLEREIKRDESIKLAKHIQNSLEKIHSINAQHNRGVKQALFYVLVGAKMPSVLVEVGFISNLEEERLLSEESFRENIAKAIVSGINNYFVSTNFGPQNIVRH
jgi:N-acetylmuramoyl-L-alanine amidase